MRPRGVANLFVASNINESVAAEFERILYQHLDPPFNAELPTQVYGTPVYHVDEDNDHVRPLAPAFRRRW